MGVEDLETNSRRDSKGRLYPIVGMLGFDTSEAVGFRPG